MAKKTVVLFLCLELALAFASCSNRTIKPSATPKPTQEVLPSNSPAPAETPEMNEDDEEELNPSEMTLPEFSDDRNEELVAAFTPEDVTVYTDIAGSIILESKQSLTELIDFYKNAAKDLGASETSVDESGGNSWAYAGTYDNGKMLTVSLRDDGGTVAVLITY
ncbi:MAG: hypothetical protein LBT88_04410 [Oscillospiraceae bacterium]|jgi:hypothetical protein|nr:hypothetical protein [Oscillospiraceae bacterium]